MGRIELDHIAIAVPRMTDAPAVLVGVLGGAPAYGMESAAFRWGQWRFAGGGRIEILEPRGRDGFLHRFLGERGPGVHHVTFKVSSLREACDRAEANGYKVVGYDDSDPSWKEAFLHPRQALGIVVQFAEEGPGGSGAHLRWVAPPGPPDPPPPVTLVGLRLSARTRERAQAQWESVAGGELVGDGPGGLVFRWPGAPMRIAVTIDPRAAEGPLAVEYSAARDVRLPSGPDPVLGTIFARAD